MSLLDAAKAVIAAKDEASLKVAVEQLATAVLRHERANRQASPLFDQFWKAYPKKIDRAGCLRKWIANDLDKCGERVIAHVVAKASTHDWRKDGFRYVPMPATYLNQRRWEEVIGIEVDDGWWKRAGFESQYDAENAGCAPHNAHAFTNGRRVASRATAGG